MINKGGVLVDRHLKQSIGSYIKSSAGFDKLQIQPASLDLTLSAKGWRIAGSFLPSKKGILDEVDIYEEIDTTKGVLLEPNIPYMFKLSEQLNLPKGFHGKSNPKSSTGRVGLLTRVVIDGAAPSFDSIPDGYKGDLYVQVISTSFPVIVKKGLALSQLRLYSGHFFTLDDSELKITMGMEPLVYKHDSVVPVDEVNIQEGLILSIDLESHDIVGFRAKKRAPPLNLTKVYHHEPLKYFEPIPRVKRLIISREEFLILSSLESLKVPPNLAAEVKPFGHGFGDLRSHYAGFFDPGFGYGNIKTKKGFKPMNGRQATLEVIPMESSLILKHGQPICGFSYERCKGVPDKIYGTTGSHYSEQSGPTLSKHFKKVPYKQLLRTL